MPLQPLCGPFYDVYAVHLFDFACFFFALGVGRTFEEKEKRRSSTGLFVVALFRNNIIHIIGIRVLTHQYLCMSEQDKYISTYLEARSK